MKGTDKIASSLNTKDLEAHEEDVLNLALDSSGLGVFSWDVKTKTIKWDKKMYELFGLPKDKPIKECDDFISALHPDDRERFKSDIKRALENKAQFDLNFRVVYRDDSIHYLGSRGKTHENGGGAALLMTGVCWDITRQGLAEEKIIADKELAIEASRLKSNFMARVSHDLRSPLNGIIGFAELMYHGKVGSISEEHKEYLGDILMSARQLLLLINHVVDLAKVESGKMEFHPEKVDFKKILDETRAIFQGMIKSKNIQFKTEVDPNLGEIIIDPSRLKQVLYNYVSNALKCTGDDGIVTVRVLPNDKKTFRLEVEDNGIGIRDVDIKRLFQEFQQIDTRIAKLYSGTGLGLALTKYIVEAQGGTVGVTSTYQQGSVFFAILPRVNK